MEQSPDDLQDMASARTNIRLAVALRETNYAKLARAAGLSRNAVSQFVTGTSSLSYANMLKVCAALDIPIGLLHQEDGITAARLRLHKAMARLPDDQIAEALEAQKLRRSEPS
ncbi:helix-turn-helix transcriptional regulator [Falsihalocynthiibacter arcticus]|uniref:helix-turn-helix domain-containing protein n=1 Tax=Falsihalocynthiibacter arcticus TaxID=1579316 RepID=UPI003003A663